MKKECWSSKLGVVLAVAGSAVGLGNFLKFPGLVAVYGGAAFMIAYVCAFFLVGVPISIVEWTLGRRGGELGYHSAAGIMGVFGGSKFFSYIGIVGAVLTLIVYCYYIYIESWCLGYAYNFLAGNVSFSDIEQARAFFANFVGTDENGGAISLASDKVLVFFLVSFLLNFFIIYKGVSAGVEAFCKVAMPTLVVVAFIVVVRMMTLGNVSPDHPERTINQGLGFMWNPVKVELVQSKSGGGWEKIAPLVGDAEIAAASAQAEKFNELSAKQNSQVRRKIVSISVFEQLSNPSIWIAACGQVFFSITIGFTAIMTYASYLRRGQDIVLSALSSCTMNEFFEVCLGGMITVPAAVAFFGVAGAIGAGLSLFDLGFKVLPLVFNTMPLGEFFGFLFFALLFIAAVTSSISMIYPSVAFLEEATRVPRKVSIPMLGMVSLFISLFVVYFSKGLKAMDTMDFWSGQVMVYIMAMIQTFLLAWVFGAEKGRRLANDGSLIKLPRAYSFAIKYVSPLVLAVVFVSWFAKDVLGLVGDGTLSPYISDIAGDAPDKVAIASVTIIAGVYFFYALMLYSSKKYDNIGKADRL